jgi:hypothetical protein
MVSTVLSESESKAKERFSRGQSLAPSDDGNTEIPRKHAENRMNWRVASADPQPLGRPFEFQLSGSPLQERPSKSGDGQRVQQELGGIYKSQDELPDGESASFSCKQYGRRNSGRGQNGLRRKLIVWARLGTQGCDANRTGTAIKIAAGGVPEPVNMKSRSEVFRR